MASITTVQPYVVKKMSKTLVGHFWCNTPFLKHKLFYRSSIAANTIHVEPTGSIQKNREDLPINQKLQTDFAVS